MHEIFQSTRATILISALPLLLAGCGKSAVDPQQESLSGLRTHILAEMSYQGSGWDVRDIYRAEGRLFAVLEFSPVEEGGQAGAAPVFSELVRLCPVTDRDDYWQSEYAESFTLYLARKGRQGAEAMAFCTPQIDALTYDRLIDRHSATLESPQQLPPPGSDLEVLNRQLGEGTPSFNDARSALDYQDLRKLQEILFARPELVDMYSSQGRTLLYEAENASAVSVLIAFGANPNVADGDGITAIGWLSQLTSREGAVKQLVEMGVNAKDSYPEYAASAEIAELLLRHGATVSDQSLYTAIENGMPGVAEVLYEHGARLKDSPLPDGVLHSLIRGAQAAGESDLPTHLAKIERFADFGADLNEKNRYGMTPFQAASQAEDWYGKSELVALLFRLGAE